MAKAKKPADIDGYISQFSADVRAVLRDVREAIRRAAPEAEETISYQMPAFRQHGILVYFAARKKDLPFKFVFLLFGAFILACGTTHLLEIWSVWQFRQAVMAM